MRRRALTAVLTAALLAVPVGFVSTASAADYPPSSTGQGTANPSRVKQGQCTNFAGDGFAPDSPLTLSDDGVRYGAATSDKKGEFREKVCFANDAKVGEHTLTADGADATAGTRRVSATVTVTGVEQTAAAPAGDAAASSSGTTGLATTRVATGPQDLRDAQSAAQTTSSAPSRPRTFFGVQAGEVLTAAGGVLLLAIPLLCSLLLVAERRYRRRRGERLAAV